MMLVATPNVPPASTERRRSTETRVWPRAEEWRSMCKPPLPEAGKGATMKRTRWAVLTAVILALTATVSADPITVTMDGRYVLTQVESQDLGGEPPDDPTYQF